MNWNSLFDIDYARMGVEAADQEIEEAVARALQNNADEIRQIALRGQARAFTSWVLAHTKPGMRSVVGTLIAEFVAHNRAIPLAIRVPLGGFLRGFVQAANVIFANENLTQADLQARLDQSWNASQEKRQLEEAVEFATGSNMFHMIHRINVACGAPDNHKEVRGTAMSILGMYQMRALCPFCFPEAATGRQITVEQVVQAAPPEIRGVFSDCPPEKAGHLAGLVHLFLKYQQFDANPDNVSPVDATDVAAHEVVVDERPGAVATFLRFIFGGVLPTRIVRPLTIEERAQIEVEMANRPGAWGSFWQFFMGAPPSRRIRERRRPTASTPLNPFEESGDGISFREMGALRHALQNDRTGLIRHLSDNLTVNDVLEDPAEHASTIIGLLLAEYPGTWWENALDTLDSWVSLPTLKQHVADFTSGRDPSSLFGAVVRIVVGFLIMVGTPILAFEALILAIMLVGVVTFLANTFTVFTLLIGEGIHPAEFAPYAITGIFAAGVIFVGRSLLPVNDDAIGFLNGLFNPLNPMTLGGTVSRQIANGLRQANILPALTEAEAAALAAQLRSVETARKRVGRFTWWGLVATHVSLIPTALMFLAVMAHPVAQTMVAIPTLTVYAVIALLAEVMKLASATVDNVRTATREETYAEMARRTIRTGLPYAITGLIAFNLATTVISWPVAAAMGEPLRYGSYAAQRYQASEAFYASEIKDTTLPAEVKTEAKKRVDGYRSAYAEAGSKGLVRSTSKSTTATTSSNGSVKKNSSNAGGVDCKKFPNHKKCRSGD